MSQTPSSSPPPMPAAAGPQKKAVGVAVAALILGIAAFIPLLGLLCGLVGLILAIAALAMRTSRKGLAIVGLALSIVGGVVGTIVLAAIIALFMQISAGPLDKAKRVACASSLHQVGMACVMHAHDQKGEFPPDLQTLVDEGTVDPGCGCPAVDLAGVRGYFYHPPEGGIMSEPRAMLACDRRDNHRGKGRNVLFVDGSVTWLSEAEFQAALVREENAAFAAALEAEEALEGAPDEILKLLDD